MNPAFLPTIIIVCALAAGTFPVEAARAKIVPEAVLRTINDDEIRILPRQGPAGLPRDLPNLRDMPTIRYRTPAEYEPESGILVRWGSFNDVLTQIIVGVTTGDSEAQAHIVVNSLTQKARAEKTLRAAGAVIERISFIHYHADSPWMRDYGPRFLAGEYDGPAMLDHTYNRFRRRDNLFPSYLSGLWENTRLSIPLIHAGGNFHVFSGGDAFATERIERDNPSVKRWRLIAWFLSVTRLNLTVYPSFPVSFDRSGHIDMWMLPVDDQKVIIGRYPAKCGLPHDITEDAASDLAARGYEVFRTPGWRSRDIHYTYTNALIFNNLVFVPVFKKYEKQNRLALEVFNKAFPTKQLIPIECTRALASSGAIHCLVMHIPEISE